MRLFAFFGSLLVLALLAALIVPPYVDWNQFRDRFEVEASRVLGLPVKVDGQTSARLLPLPSVTFTDITIGDPEGEEAKLSADSFTLDIELAPLLKGDVVIVEMRLEKPLLTAAMDKAGRVLLPQLHNPGGGLPDADVQFENVSVVDGAVIITDQRFDRKIDVKNINASVSSRSLTGPWRGQGTLEQGGEKFRLSASTGRWQENNQARLKVELEPQSAPYRLQFDGPISLAEQVPSISGKLNLSPVISETDSDKIEFPRSLASALPIGLEADVEVGTGGATVPAFRLNIGTGDDPYIVTGNGQAIFAEEVTFRVRAEGQQMDVARLADSTSGSASLSERLERFREMLKRVPRFDLDGEINLYLPAVILDDTVVREVGMDLRPAKDGSGWRLGNLEALLPGRTDLRADGILRVGDRLEYEGDLIVASKQPSGLATWLGADSQSAIRQLSAAGFSAKASLVEGVSSFDDVEIVLDDQSIKGTVRRESADGVRPRLLAVLSGNKANFDQLSALFELFSGSSEAGGIAAHDLDLKLVSKSFFAAGVNASGLSAQLRLNEGELVIDQLDIEDVNGAAISATGRVEDISNSALGELTLNLTAADPGPFLTQMNSRFGPFPLFGFLAQNSNQFINADLNTVFNGKSDGYSIAVSGTAGGTKVDVSFTGDKINEEIEKQQIDAKLVLVNDRYSTLMAQLGVPILTLDGDGKGAFRGLASGKMADGLRTEGALTVADGFLSFSGSAKPRIKAGDLNIEAEQQFTAEVLDFDQFILRSGLPLPGIGNGGNAKLSGNLSVSPKQLSVGEIKGSLRDVEFAGGLSVDLEKVPRPEVSGTLKFNEIDLPVATSLVFTGNQSDATERVAPLFAGLDGTIQLRAEKVSVAEDIPPATKLETSLSLRDGDFGFSDVRASWLDGEVSGQMSLAQTTSARLMNGQLSLKNGQLPKVIKLAEIGGEESDAPVKGKVSVTGTFESADSTGSGLIAGLTASGVARIEEGKIERLNALAFKPVLRDADQTADDQVANRTEAMLMENLESGAFEFQKVDIPFNVAAGVLRANSVRISSDELTLAGKGKLDLNSLDGDANLKLNFLPGKEIVVGANPELTIDFAKSGDGISRTIDTSLFSTYLGMRISERREREFEAQRAEVLERQRLMRMVRIYSLKDQAERLAAEEQERIRKLEIEQEERRKREEARRKLQEIEQKKIEAALKAAQKEADREAALEAGRREKRQQEIELLRKKSLEALDRLREQQEFKAVPDGTVIEN